MVLNLTRNTVVAHEVRVAQNFVERMRGLIGSKPLTEGEGFFIPLCQGIHTLGMGYPIDVLYLDGEGRIIVAFKDMVPNRLGSVSFKTQSVLELPQGAINRSRSRVGDLIDLGHRAEPVRPPWKVGLLLA